MLPTAKDSTLLPTSPETSERTPGGATAGPQISSAQPVTLEVPVTVNGARAVEGSDKREPFSETTSTVLVLINGAVIRLSSAVAPGQLLFLTNDKTKKEVVCQVVKSKHYRSASGYVELEFTEPVLGFWGMRFPGERPGAPARASLPAARKLASPALPAGIPATNAEPQPTLRVDARPVEDITTNLADDVQEFKTEIKADARPSSKADFLAPAEASTVAPTLDANRLEQQLSELLSAEEKQSEGSAVSAAPPSKQDLGDAAAKIFDMANDEPAAPKDTPTPVTSSFDAEEVKIPAWLEPLARNAAIPAPPAETGASDSAAQLEEWQAPQAPELTPAAKQAPVAAKKTVSASKRARTTPVFGKTLLGESAPTLTGARRSGKGIWKAIAAGLIVAAASGAWYFHDSWAPAQSSPASNAAQASTASSSLLPPASNTQPTAGVTPSSTPMEGAEAPALGRKANSEGATEAPAPASSVAQGKMQTTAITERISKSGSKNDLSTGPAKSAEPDEAEIQKRSLGEIRLAKPKVRRSNNVQANGEMEPALEENSSELPGGENSLGANLADSSKQPAAPPAPLGGDVKPARLISSAPPSYPALARTQHIAGDVRVDALIDATGRVTTMKVVSGPSLLHQAAMDALRRWKYEAATLDGKPVAMHLTVTIQFRLQ
jgi:protein TonB